MSLKLSKSEFEHLHSYGYFKKKNEKKNKSFFRAYDIGNFVFSLFQNILTRKKNLHSKKPDQTKKIIQRKIEKKIYYLLFQNSFFSLDNNNQTLSFLVFSLKENLKKKSSDWIAGFLSKKPSSVYLWQICILWEWKNSRSFKTLDSLINIGLKSSKFNPNLFKEYIRFKIFFFKNNVFKSTFNKKKIGSLGEIQILFVIFCSILRGAFPKIFISKVIQVHGKEIWSFLRLGENFLQIMGMIKSKFSSEKILMKVLAFLPLPPSLFKCLVINKVIEKTKFYLKVLNPQLGFKFFMLFHAFYLADEKKHDCKSSKKKKNTSEFLKIDSLLR